MRDLPSAIYDRYVRRDSESTELGVREIDFDIRKDLAISPFNVSVVDE